MGLEFNKCCFCIELRTGCLIIGYLNLIVDIIYIVMSIVGVAAVGAVTDQAKDFAGAFTDQAKDFPGAVTVQGKDFPDVQKLGTVMLAVMVTMLIFLILFLAFTVVLLVGLHKYKRGHVKVYMVYTLIFLVLYVILFFAGFAGPISAGKIAQDLISILISVYFLLVIRSYYLKMDDPANNTA